MNDLAPGLKMDFVFNDLSTPAGDGVVREVHVNDCDKFPKKRFPVDKFELVSQVTRMKVNEMTLTTFE